jgi:RNA polymerase sigma factor (sigma-70 family)
LTEIDEIIAQCKEDKSWAQEKLFKLFAPKMLGICRRYLSNIDDARDAMQDGFVKAFLNIHKYEGRSSFNTWISRIMMNTAIDMVKKINKIQFVRDDYYLNDHSDSEEDHLIDDLDLSQEQLLALIDLLPPGYKLVFNLYAIESLSHKDIAALLGISEGTSKSQLNRARTFLKTEIKKIQAAI